MRLLVFLTLIACALALEYTVNSIPEQKESYKYYLRKVIGFFNETVHTEN